jgi:hypothetical protein
MDLILNPKKIINIFVYTAMLLFLGHIISQVLIFVAGDNFFHGFVPLFDFDKEKNLPTFFSSLALFIASVLLAIIAMARTRHARYFWHWLVMSALFLFLSFDELASIHEKLIDPVQESLQVSGIFYYAWIIPYGIAVILLGFLYFRFVIDLPSKTRMQFIIAGACYVTGALVFEALGGAIFDRLGTRDILSFAVLMTIEETLEIVGVVYFIYALLSYLQEHLPGLRIMMTASK